MVVSGVSDNSDSYNTYLCKKKGSALSNHIQGLDERLQLVRRESAEPLFDRIRCHVPDFLEQLTTFRRDPSRDVPPVVGIALATDQLGLFQPIEKPWDIRHPRDHALSDLTSAQSLLPGTAKNPQHIELRACKPERPKQLVARMVDNGRSAQQAKDRLVLQRGERLVLLDLGLKSTGHVITVTV
jgi:hypothetical protein